MANDLRFECFASVAQSDQWISHDREFPDSREWTPQDDDEDEEIPRIVSVRVAPQPKPKVSELSELGKRLVSLRQKIVESGVPLLTLDQIHDEIATRRRERE